MEELRRRREGCTQQGDQREPEGLRLVGAVPFENCPVSRLVREKP